MIAHDDNLISMVLGFYFFANSKHFRFLTFFSSDTVFQSLSHIISIFASADALDALDVLQLQNIELKQPASISRYYSRWNVSAIGAGPFVLTKVLAHLMESEVLLSASRKYDAWKLLRGKA